MSINHIWQEKTLEKDSIYRAINQEEMKNLPTLLLPLIENWELPNGWIGRRWGYMFVAMMEYPGRGIYGLIGCNTLQLVGFN